VARAVVVNPALTSPYYDRVIFSSIRLQDGCGVFSSASGELT
jgi:hypothetical protein